MAQRTDPFSEIDRVFNRLSRQFEDLGRDWEQMIQRGTAGVAGISIDLVDNGDEFVVTADVPGFEKDEIELRLRDNTLFITAEHEESTEEEEEEQYIRSEREHRAVVESVRIPAEVDEDQISASYQNGVLTVHLPKVDSTETEGREIKVE
ncbi:Hsp20/alpha crystallin family protein [halophilic archaeon]|nr:Hsp20/alpha crystallin family protein [halophilic archaeon]